MNFKKLMTAFLIALPVCVGIRIIQIIFTIEYSNGFYIIGKSLLGNIALVLIALIGVAGIVLALKTKNVSIRLPKKDIVLGVLSILVAISLGGELFGEATPMTMTAWQVWFLKSTTLFTAVYFTANGISMFLGFKLPTLLCVMPAVYAIVKTIFTFINISSLALISDNILLMASYCCLMLFFINYGKVYNGIDVKTAFPKLAARGFVTAIICGAQSLSAIIINIFGNTPYTHINNEVLYSLFCLSAFTAAFVYKTAKIKEDNN